MLSGTIFSFSSKVSSRMKERQKAFLFSIVSFCKFPYGCVRESEKIGCDVLKQWDVTLNNKNPPAGLICRGESYFIDALPLSRLLV
jgi:hypothetical protein